MKPEVEYHKCAEFKTFVTRYMGIETLLNSSFVKSNIFLLLAIWVLKRYEKLKITKDDDFVTRYIGIETFLLVSDGALPELFCYSLYGY